MLSMLVVVIVVISGNGVLAAQRDSYKLKDMSSSNNAIPSAGAGGDATAVSSVAAGTGSMNGNTNGNENGNNKNAHATTDMNASSSSSSSSSSTSGSGAVTLTTTTTSSGSGSSSSSSMSNGIASSSLHKGNTISSPAGASGINRNTIELIDDSRNGGPYFDKAASKNVTALLGKTAYLNCRVKNLGNKTMLLQVSWVRHRDIHLLTVGRYTYTSDQRFRAIHQPQTEDWMLQIKYPQHRDSGIYECQVSTTPHMSHNIHLTVVEPSTEIIGAPDLYIESGSTINLTCVILNSPEPPAYIFWNHNNAIINYDSPRGGVSVVTNKGETTTSFLLIKSARPSDSGHYQCNPSNAKPKSVTVHVLNGEFPAAMQHAAPAHPHMSPSRYLLVYLFVCYCSLAFARHSMRPSAAQLRQPPTRCSRAIEEEAATAAAAAADAMPEIAEPATKRFCRYPAWDTYSSVF
ncbi:dpr9 [Drosophila busckii]|uniref:Dpr9 n=2 Tax=Drosophila busckii TaxID=30019 RepID=A0A0M5IZI2_DROBS|nr:dpr9 [Drosophila busckii]